jgi:hypothetical protein
MKTCVECNREFRPSSRHLRCPGCRAKSVCACGGVKQVKSATCGSCRTVGESFNGNWKGGRTMHKAGYLMIRVPGHPRAGRSPYIFEHILVAESMLCRFLVPGETVHHLNGVRDDNRPENLELWTRPQPSGIRVSDAIQWAHAILDHEGEGVKPSPTMSEASLGHPWRCWESNPGPSASW